MGRAGIVAVHNLAADPCVVRIELGDVEEDARLDDLLDERPALDELDGTAVELKLDGYGYRWFRIVTPDRMTPP